MQYVAIAISIGSFLITAAGLIWAGGKLVQKLASHEELDTERHEANQEMLKEMRQDIKLLLMTKQ